MIDPLIVARAVHLAATAICAGVIFFDVVIARPVLSECTDKDTRAYFATLDRLAWAGLALVAVSGVAWALLLAAQLGETSISQAITDGTVTTLLTETRFGQVWLGRAVLAAIVAVTLLPIARRFGWLRLSSAGLLLIAVAWVGHSGARTDAVGWLQVCADMAHLLAAGVWLGSLPALAVLLASSGRNRIPPTAAAVATRRFSFFGVLAVAALLVSGIINTWLLIEGVSALTETGYGRLLLLKIGLFTAMLVLASINRWHWTPRMPDPRAIGMVRRNSLIEAGLGISVIVVVGVLGTLAPPLHQHVHANDAPPEAAFVHIHDVKAMADVTVLPGRAGRSEIWLRLMREDFTALPADAVTVRLAQSGQPPVVAEARSGVVGLWRAPDVVLPAAGVWSIVVKIQTGRDAPVVLDASIVLEP